MKSNTLENVKLPDNNGMDRNGVASGIRRPFSVSQEALIEAHLQELLASKAFAGSRRSSEFLRYVVMETLAGFGPHIKERNIATDVFAKGADFDPQSESIVRVGAAEVRKRLASAYQDGIGGQVRIELPVGSYQPNFQFTNSPATVQNSSNSRKRIVKAPWIALAIAAAATVSWLLLWPPPTRESPLDLVWRPFLNSGSPVLISLPAPTVLELKHKDRWLPLTQNAQIPAAELLVKQNYFVGVGAAFGAAHFAEQLTLRHQPFFVKFGGDANFSDLNRFPAILLGAFSSPLTMEMTRNLRFHFYTDDEKSQILDSQKASSWSVRKQAAGEPSEGYALVCRLLQPDSGHPLLIVAGLSARDTQAAVAFLVDRNYFESFARAAPTDWPHKNIEIVLHSVVHGDAPSVPQVITFYVW